MNQVFVILAKGAIWVVTILVMLLGFLATRIGLHILLYDQLIDPVFGQGILPWYIQAGGAIFPGWAVNAFLKHLLRKYTVHAASN